MQAGGCPASVLATKHAETMAQKSIIDPSCGTAARLPHTNAAQSEQSTQCAKAYQYLSVAHYPLVQLDKPSVHTQHSRQEGSLLADLNGLVCGVYSSDAALKVPSTSLITSLLIPVRAGAWVRRVVAISEGSGGCKREGRGSQRHGTSNESGGAIGGGGGGGGGRSEGCAKP